VNERATALVKKVFGEQYPYGIHGDLAILDHKDFR
jgi:hypothetical protein